MSPTGGLNQTNIPTPRAAPLFTTDYTVNVTDLGGQSAQATVRVNVNFELSVTATPEVIDFGDISQLNATARAGAPPYTFAWSPAKSLDDPTIHDPLASPLTTTIYAVTATDADGVTPMGAVQVAVRLVLTALTVTVYVVVWTIESGTGAGSLELTCLGDLRCDPSNPAILWLTGGEGSGFGRGTATLTVFTADEQSASLTLSYR